MQSKLSLFFVGIGCLSSIIGVVLFIYLLFQGAIGAAFLYGFILFMVMLVLAAIGGNIDIKKKEKQKNVMISMKPQEQNFHDSLSYASDDLLSKITLDHVNEQLYIWTPKDKNITATTDVKPGMAYQYQVYAYDDILSVEHIEDGEVITKITRQSPSARFYLEGLPQFENIQITEKKSDNEVNLITLKLLFRDKAKPFHGIQFYMNPSTSLQKNLAEYKQIKKDLQQWLTTFHLLIKEADQKEGHIVQDETDSSEHSMSRKIIAETKTFAVGKAQPSEQNTIICTKLLPVLKQVMHQKTQEDSRFINTAKLETSPLQSSSYFDELLKKNREMMHGKHDE